MDTDKILQFAFGLGVSDARLIAVNVIHVEERLAKMCEEPRCKQYGQSANCPPHVMKPVRFRETLPRYECALAFKFDVPTAVLLSDDRYDVSRLLHETAAAIEGYAKEHGFPNSRGLAGGSCKPLFCHEHPQCEVISGGGVCRHPDLARPSMSGLGINFSELSKTLGWQIDRITQETDSSKVPMGLMAGMVLMGR